MVWYHWKAWFILDSFSYCKSRHTVRFVVTRHTCFNSNTGGCSSPLGMSTNEIPDADISASSHRDKDHMPQHGRLLDNSYWMPLSDDVTPWLEVEFPQQMIISGLVIEGHLSLDRGWIWVDAFHVKYSRNGVDWKPYVYFTDNDKVRVWVLFFNTCFLPRLSTSLLLWKRSCYDRKFRPLTIFILLLIIIILIIIYLYSAQTKVTNRLTENT